MIKSNTIIDPTQSPIVVVVSGIGEKISDVNGDVMTQQRQHQSGSERCEQSGSWTEEPVLNQKSSSTELEREKPWCERGITHSDTHTASLSHTMFQTAQNFIGLVTMQPSTHLSVVWGVIKCRCHGDRPLAMKHDVAVSPMDTVQSSPNLHLYITGPCLNSSTPNLKSHHMPFPWKRIPRHKTRCPFNSYENVQNSHVC